MTDRRLLRRYLALVHHAEDLLEQSLGDATCPAPAEAVAVIEELVITLEPTVGRMPAHSPQPQDIRLTLAGWTH
jgi:hypothetical protein